MILKPDKAEKYLVLWYTLEFDAHAVRSTFTPAICCCCCLANSRCSSLLQAAEYGKGQTGETTDTLLLPYWNTINNILPLSCTTRPETGEEASKKMYSCLKKKTKCKSTTWYAISPFADCCLLCRSALKGIMRHPYNIIRYHTIMMCHTTLCHTIPQNSRMTRQHQSLPAGRLAAVAHASTPSVPYQTIPYHTVTCPTAVPQNSCMSRGVGGNSS